MCEATWHAGHSLADTLLTCLYIQAPDALAAPAVVARAVVAASRTQAGQCRALALRADIYEEDDFVPHPFGFDFEPDAAPAGVESTVALLAEAQAFLAAASDDAPALPGLTPELRLMLGAHLRLRAALISALQTLAAAEAVGGGSPAAALPQLAAAAAAVADLRSRSPLGGEETPLPPSLAASVGFDCAVSRRLLGGALPRVIKLQSRATALATTAAFVRHLQLAAAAPARLRTVTAAAAWMDAFARGASDDDDALPATLPGTLARSAALLALLPDAKELRSGLCGGAALQQVVLCELWAPLWLAPEVMSDDEPPEVLPGGVEALTAAARGLLLVKEPSDPPSGKDLRPPPWQTTPPCVRALLEAGARAGEGSIRALASNRARSRRRLRHVIAEWHPLLALAAVAEAPGLAAPVLAGETSIDSLATVAALRLQPSPWQQLVASCAGEAWAASRWGANGLSAWAGGWVAATQAAHLEAGLALELYAPDELCPLFWYCEYLDSVHLEAMRVAADSVATLTAREPLQASHLASARLKQAGEAARAARAAVEEAKPGGKPAAKRAADAAMAAAVAAEAQARSAALLASTAMQRPTRATVSARRLEAHRALCRGHARLAAALTIQGRLPSVADPFNDEFHRFWLRFGTLHNYETPAPLHYEQYAEFAAAAKALPPAQLYAAAKEAFVAAAQGFKLAGAALAGAAKREAAAAARCAGAAAVAAGLLMSAGPDSALKLALEPGHLGWPVPAVTRVQT